MDASRQSYSPHEDASALPIEEKANAGAPQAKQSLATRISRVVWGREKKSDEERKFVRRLDCGLMPIIMASYYVKYLSQANVANAYVSGMKEDLKFTGDEYNLLLTCFTVGYTIGQFPATLLMVKVSPSVWLPGCEILWLIVVMAMAACKTPQQMMACRFLIGMLEASSYPGGIWLLGSWYNKHELGKRAVLFICSSSIGTMFSGFLQAAVLGLGGRHGLPAWAWLFIIDGCIGLPIAIAGFFVIPDVPERPNPRAKWWLRPQDIAIGRDRLARMKRAEQVGWSVKTFKQAFFGSWVPWVLGPAYICFVMSLNSFAYMNLWLKSTKLYTTAEVNLIPIGGYGLQLVSAALYSFTSDAIAKRWPVILFGGMVALIGNIILATWPGSNNVKFAGFYLAFTLTPCGALTLSWANELVSGMGAEHRAIIIGYMNTASYVFNAWVPNLIFPASKAPVYKGRGSYRVTSVFIAVLMLGISLAAYLEKRDVTRKSLENPESGEATESGSELEADAVVEGEHKRHDGLRGPDEKL